MRTYVVNKYKHIPGENIQLYIGRPSVLGNPYKIGEHGNRAEVISLYTKHFLHEITYDSPLRQKLDEIGRQSIKEQRHIDLVCYCAPHHCHGDVIKIYFDSALTNMEDPEEQKWKTRTFDCKCCS